MKTYVLYHANCWDGFCAAWIAKGVLQGEIEFISVQYSERPPCVDVGSRVYILDFCYPRQTLLKDFCDIADTVIVLDHHKTAEEQIAGLEHPVLVAKFDMNKSGGRLAWEHFYGKSGMKSPGLVDYTEDRDLWRWALPGSKAVNACLRSYPLDFALWDKWGHLSPIGLCELFVEEGQAILRREQQIVDEHVGHAHEIEMDGHKILAVNATVLFSDIAGQLAKDRPFGACWFERQDGKRQWSLRSRNGGVDVAEIAKRHGGGGHKHAAGFEVVQ